VSFGGGINQTNQHFWIDALPFSGVGYSENYGKAEVDAIEHHAMLIGDPDLLLDVLPL